MFQEGRVDADRRHKRRPHHLRSSTDDRVHTTAATTKHQPKPVLQTEGPDLEACNILSHPRLQQATGMLPRKLGWWEGVEPPHDELMRLQWTMSLPDTYPQKKPRGNF
ncbi:hypothetical protein F4775DRAFT_596873 [Biscogniauxia sp. FL1348]|nr:hypothetical protein F4775DRAFT_596873 [Biscogniauxia sp. FL1348]